MAVHISILKILILSMILCIFVRKDAKVYIKLITEARVIIAIIPDVVHALTFCYVVTATAAIAMNVMNCSQTRDILHRKIGMAA